MGNMSKQEIIDEMISEGYDYDTAYKLVCGEDKQETKQTNCEKHSKKQCTECKYLDCCDRASVCDGNCAHCDITDCENNQNKEQEK